MKKKFWLALLIMFAPFVTVNAESQTVNDETELKAAIGNEEIDTIIIGKDIDTTSKINITRPLYLDGNNHTLRYTGKFKGGDDATVWDGIYVLQVYKTMATIKDIKLTGANAALLINGGNVTFEGTIDVSGNGFGGIELGQGAGVTEIPKLALKDDAEIQNTTEKADAPSLWVPADTTKGVLEINGESKDITKGDELSLAEIEEIFDIDNPSTNDFINTYLITAILSLLGITTSLSYLKTKKEF